MAKRTRAERRRRAKAAADGTVATVDDAPIVADSEGAAVVCAGGVGRQAAPQSAAIDILDARVARSMQRYAVAPCDDDDLGGWTFVGKAAKQMGRISIGSKR